MECVERGLVTGTYVRTYVLQAPASRSLLSGFLPLSVGWACTPTIHSSVAHVVAVVAATLKGQRKRAAAAAAAALKNSLASLWSPT